jgi:hypothetical protein
MKHIFSLVLFFFHFQLNAEGFKKGTLVKVPHGYTKIEELNVGDIVISCDFLTPCVERKVTATESHFSENAIEINLFNETIITENDHKIYVDSAKEFLLASKFESQPIDETIELFNISVEGTHNYYVTKKNILVHNFFMAITAAIPVIGPIVAPVIMVGTLITAAVDQFEKEKQRKNEQRQAKEESQKREQQERERQEQHKKEDSKKKISNPGQMQQEVNRGQAPKSIDRIDKGRGPYEQDHVHFEGGAALNKDGTWKHGGKELSNQEREWLDKHGWKYPK